MTAFLSILFTACATSPRDSSTTRRWIVGFGWVDSVHDRAVDAQSLVGVGIIADREGIQAGIIQSNRITIDPTLAEDALVRVDSSPMKLTVAARSIESPADHP